VLLVARLLMTVLRVDMLLPRMWVTVAGGRGLVVAVHRRKSNESQMAG
jgi:hypothetical protein